LAQGIPINLHSYMKFLALRSLAKRTGARSLIEAGTFRGVTSGRCAGVFERVLTVELDEELARRAALYLKRFPNVEVFHGDAVELLPRLISRPDMSAAAVFLDAHFRGATRRAARYPSPPCSSWRSSRRTKTGYAAS
jgi:predicted O-methyltransferase YrrM